MKPRRERDTEQSFGLVWFLFCLENHLWWIVKDGEQEKGDPVEQCRGLSGQWRRRGSTSASSYH